MKNLFNINEKIISLSKIALKKCENSFNKIEKISEHNSQKMLKAFIDNKVSESHFVTTTGYGYDDRGRETLDKVFAQAVEAESAIVRHNFVSGTHAITVALFGLLRPNDKMLCITGTPYNTLRGVIGIEKKGSGSLIDFGIKYNEINLLDNGQLDFEAIRKNINKELKLVYIQRSCGYELRKSLFTKDIEKVVKIIKEKTPSTVVMVDNCYGEFVEEVEPTNYKCGADIIIGSLLKNPGGGIARTGGYIAGKKELVEKCACRLTTSSTGNEVGATLGLNRELFMGIFNAPNVTAQALKTSVFASALFSELGYDVYPKTNEERADIIQIIKLGNKNSLIKFCKAIQSGSAIDSFVSPEPGEMPGYNCDIIMASGSFTLGSSIELSADAPLKEPYCVWLQGGTNFDNSKIGVMMAAQEML